MITKSVDSITSQKWTEEKTKADGEIKKLQNELKTKEANLAKLER